MKFGRPRKPTSGLIQDIYLPRSWGSRYYIQRERRLDRRQFFIIVMLAVGLLDLGLAAFFVIAYLVPPVRPASTAATRAAQTRTVIARAEPTRVSPTRTRRAPGPTVAPLLATATRERVATAAPVRTRRPTATTEPPAEPAQPEAPAAPANLAPPRTLALELPGTLQLPALAIGVPPEPLDCTHADQMPDPVTSSVKLCPGETYPPIVLRGQDIGIFGDEARSAVIRSNGRAFAITAEGARLYIARVIIRASTEAGDARVLLCLYADCRGRSGGIIYGGGILIRASDTTVMDSQIAGGVAGIAAERVRGVKLVNNVLDNSTGWGSYNFAVEESFFVGNSLSGNNRSCVTPDGVYLQTGCESAGWVCIACQQNVVAQNTCTNSGDCYYINGEGNLASNLNRFHRNVCRASPHNCFEVTFSRGNEFVENVAESDPATGAACKYPFWVGGSQVVFARNQWRCAISASTALQHATDSTNAPTSIVNQ